MNVAALRSLARGESGQHGYGDAVEALITVMASLMAPKHAQ